MHADSHETRVKHLPKWRKPFKWSAVWDALSAYPRRGGMLVCATLREIAVPRVL